MSRRLLGPTAIYGASNILVRAIPFLLLPILTRYLSRADFGVVAVFTAISGVASPFVGLNVSAALRRKYFDVEAEQLASYVTACAAIVAIGTTVCTLGAFAIGGWLEPIAEIDRIWIVLAVVHAGARVFILLPLTLWQVEDRPLRYAVVQVGRSAVSAGLTLVLVAGYDLGADGALLGLAATSSAFALLVALPALFPLLRRRLARDDVRHAVRYGSGMIVHVLGGLAIISADRFFVTHYAGAAVTGLYFVGYQIGFVVSLVADAYNRAWSPWLYAGLESGDAATKRTIVRNVYLAFGALAVLAVAVTLVAPLVTRYLLSEEFATAHVFVAWIAAGFAINGMYRVVSGVVFYAERTRTLSVITAIAALVNIGLNQLLVPSYGAIGAAQATAAAFSVGFVLTFGLTTRIERLPWLVWR